MTNIIKRAKQFAALEHKQHRNGKYPMIHAAQVARIIKTLTSDINLISAAYLHDLLEDTDATHSELTAQFNKDIADLVWEVTKTGYNRFPHLKTLRGVILKFADRLSNLSNISSKTKAEQKKYLRKSKFWT